MTSGVIKVEYCVAYDWARLEHSLPAVYAQADRICLSIDRDRKSWSGERYEFDEGAFRALLARLDPDHKVEVYEDDFHRPDLDPMGNDIRQRRLMAQHMGEGGWHVQVDVDEYFLDFAGFVAELRRLDPEPRPERRPMCVYARWTPLFKRVEGGYLYVDFGGKAGEQAPIATNCPEYVNSRVTQGKAVHTPFVVVHDTWARSEAELWQKFSNWGHAKDFDARSYFNLWKAVDAANCRYLRDFHPLYGPDWPRLGFHAAADIGELIQAFRAAPAPGRPRWAPFRRR